MMKNNKAIKPQRFSIRYRLVPEEEYSQFLKILNNPLSNHLAASSSRYNPTEDPRRRMVRRVHADIVKITHDPQLSSEEQLERNALLLPSYTDNVNELNRNYLQKNQSSRIPIQTKQIKRELSDDDGDDEARSRREGESVKQEVKRARSEEDEDKYEPTFNNRFPTFSVDNTLAKTKIIKPDEFRRARHLISNLMDADRYDVNTGEIKIGRKKFSPSLSQKLVKDAITSDSEPLHSTAANWNTFAKALQDLKFETPRRATLLPLPSKKKGSTYQKGGRRTNNRSDSLIVKGNLNLWNKKG